MNGILTIGNKDTSFIPSVIEGVTLELERRGAPSKLSFKVLNDGLNKFDVGNQVTFKWKNNKMFCGYIFNIEYSASDEINITCYDQLRYLKNKDTFVYKNKTASEVIKQLASKFKITCGDIENTSYVMTRICDNMTLFDIINESLDYTLINQRKLYVLFDNFGKLTLKSIDNMQTKVLITEDNTGDYSYSVSIDENTYNRVKLEYRNENTGKRDLFIEEDSSTQKQWGLLQYYEVIDDKKDAVNKAQKLLNLYNRPTKNLELNNVQGDCSVRAGSGVLCNIAVGAEKIKTNMLVESCTHNFYLDEHTMNLTLKGRVLNV